MDEPGLPNRIRRILGSDGTWVVPVLALLGVAATFVSFGWLGGLLFVIVVLFLLLIVFARAALQVQTASEPSGHRPEAAKRHAEEDDSARDGLPSSALEVEAERSSAASEAIDGQAEEDEESALQRGLDAAFEGDVEAAREALDEWIAEEDESAEVLNRTALKELLLVRAGDDGALERLRRLADENDRHAEVQRTFANALAAQGALQALRDERGGGRV